MLYRHCAVLHEVYTRWVKYILEVSTVKIQEIGGDPRSVRALAHQAFAFVLISFDVCLYMPLLGVASPIENNGSQMYGKRERS